MSIQPKARTTVTEVARAQMRVLRRIMRQCLGCNQSIAHNDHILPAYHSYSSLIVVTMSCDLVCSAATCIHKEHINNSMSTLPQTTRIPNPAYIGICCAIMNSIAGSDALIDIDKQYPDIEIDCIDADQQPRDI
jgi:hypothetical protein